MVVQELAGAYRTDEMILIGDRREERGHALIIRIAELYYRGASPFFALSFLRPFLRQDHAVGTVLVFKKGCGTTWGRLTNLRRHFFSSVSGSILSLPHSSSSWTSCCSVWTRRESG